MVIDKKYYANGTVQVIVYMWNPTTSSVNPTKTRNTTYQVVATYAPPSQFMNDYTKSFDTVREAIDHMSDAAKKLQSQPAIHAAYGYF